MDINTGRLVHTEEKLSPAEFRARYGAGMEPVPDHLQEEALRELAGRKEAFVDLQTDSPLSRHAKERRRARRKAERAARRKTRDRRKR